MSVFGNTLVKIDTCPKGVLMFLRCKLAGIKNLIPVGSAVTKSIRKESFMIDIVLNYSITHESKPV